MRMFACHYYAYDCVAMCMLVNVVMRTLVESGLSMTVCMLVESGVPMTVCARNLTAQKRCNHTVCLTRNQTTVSFIW
jgi:hypothetical protein